MKLNIFKIIGLVISPLLAIGCGHLLISRIFPQMPSDFGRTEFIMESLAEPEEEPPKVLLFGNSILMNGVDAKQLGENIGMECWNMSSPGQSVVEGALFFQEIPTDVGLVVQFIAIKDLRRIHQPANKVLRNFYLFGYRPSAETTELLSDSLLRYFSQSDLRITFEGREILVNTMNRSVRTLLRDDLALKALQTEKYFPNPYTKRVPDAQYDKLIKRFNFLPEDIAILFRDQPRQLFQNIQSYFHQRGIHYQLVLYPINPDLTNYNTEVKQDLKELLNSLPDSYPPILNLTELLAPEDFIDHWHPAQSGADKLTQRLSEHLKSLPHAVSLN